MTNDDDLRTALTKLAVKYENLGNDDVASDAVWCDLINALTAHPAPETAAPRAIQWAPSGSFLDGVPSEMTRFLAGSDGTTWGYSGGPGAAMTFGTGPWPESIDVLPGQWVVRHDDGTFTVQDDAPAPVSDTRRENDELVETVARALQEHANSLARDLEWGEGVPFEDLAPHMQVARRGQARAVLAVLPAPPVVDEAEIAALIRSHNAAPANELEARIGLKNGCTCGEPGMAADHQAAAVAAHPRGATHG